MCRAEGRARNSGQTILLPVPPPLPPVDEYLANALAPARRLLAVFARSWESGAQLRFATRAWDKAVGSERHEPWRLLARAWETVRRSGGDDEK